MMTFLIISLILFILGLCFGSMGSVLVHRLMILQNSKNKLEILKGIIIGRSHCPKCGHVLGVKDLIPILSWFFLRGKCRYCGAKVSIVYPLLELGSGLIFLFTFLFLSFHFARNNLDFWILYGVLVLNFYFFYLLVIGDILYFYLIEPIRILWFLFNVFVLFLGVGDLKIGFFGAIIFFIGFLAIYFFGKFYVKLRFGLKDVEGFGFGDVMVGFMLGLSLGIIYLIYKFSILDIFYIFIIYIFLSSFIGLVLALIWFLYNLLIKKQKIGGCIQFLPPMFVAWIVLVFYLDKFLNFVGL